MPNHTSKLSRAAAKLEMPIVIKTGTGSVELITQDNGIEGDQYIVRSEGAADVLFWRLDAAWLCALSRLANAQEHARSVV